MSSSDRFGFGEALSSVLIRPTPGCDNYLEYLGIWLVDQRPSFVRAMMAGPMKIRFSEIGPDPSKFPVHVLVYIDSYWDPHLIISSQDGTFECLGDRRVAEIYSPRVPGDRKPLVGALQSEIDRVLPMLMREDRAGELACKFYFRLDHETDERIAHLYESEEAEIVGDALVLAHKMRAKYKRGSQDVKNQEEPRLDLA